jgi:hypothetical protein
MPQGNSLISRLRHGRAWDEWDEHGEGEHGSAAPHAAENPKPRSQRRRIVVTVTFAALFVAGAAFSAAAGDQVRSSLEDSAVLGQAAAEGTTTDGTTTDTTTTAPASTDPAPADDSGSVGGGGSPAPAGAPENPEPAADVAPPTASVAAPAASAVVQQAATSSDSITSAASAPSSGAAAQGTFAGLSGARSSQHSGSRGKQAGRVSAPELDGAASGVVWLNRPLPDPTPLALRLAPLFASHLQAVARANHVSWAVLLGVLRAQGHDGAAPANLGGLRALAARLSTQGASPTSPWAKLFFFSNDTSFADRAVALSHYYRAVGLRALVHGLDAEKNRLGQKVLNDPRVSIYAGGRGDIESGRVNVRVLAAIEYLADSFGQVTVSCLISGHRLYARPGVISAHIYGLAADISEVGGTPIFGHQQPGGVTERAVRDLLLLPPELLPKQVISLLGLGGPSFPLANHYDHIHIGY